MKQEGSIGETPLLDQVLELGQEKFTGALRFENDAIIKIIYFKDGDVLSASTNDRLDSVDEILLRAGKLTREHIKQSLGKRKETETLGDAMLALGFITKKELTWARRAQVIGILRSIDGWSSGSWSIVTDYLPKREEGTIFRLHQLLLEMLVTDPDRERVERQLDGGAMILQKMPGFDAAYASLNLNEEADSIVALIDGRQTASEIAARSSRDVFNVFKLLNALHLLGLLGLLGRAQKPQVTREVYPGALSPVASVMSATDGPGSLVDETPEGHGEPERPVESSDDSFLPSGSPAWEQPQGEPAVSFEGELTAPEPETEQTGALLREHRGPGQRALWGTALVLFIVAAGLFAWYRHGKEQEKNASGPSSSAPAAVASPATDFASTAPATRTPPPPEAPTAAPIVIAPPPLREGSVTTPRPSKAPPSARPARPQPEAASPVRASPADPTRARYESMAREFAAKASPSEYTLQVELVCQNASIAKALEEGKTKVWFTSTTYRGQNCFRVYWGRYRTREAAAAAAGEIPLALRGSTRPVVVSVRNVLQR